MKNLAKLRNLLKSHANTEFRNYYIPKTWNLINYKNFYSQTDLEIEVNPYDFFLEVINYILQHKKHNVPSKMSLANFLKEDNGGNWLKSSIIYSMQIRTSSAYKHDHENISDGTFLKTIALIPYLIHIGINTLYLLPITKIARKYHKGELGSPYSADSFTVIEPTLADALLPNTSAEFQFLALVEALHCLKMRVVVDFIPRTIGRGSSLVGRHPDWFYYVKTASLPSYQAPYVDKLPALSAPTRKNCSIAYDERAVKQFLDSFSLSPDKLDPKIWNEIKDKDNVIDLMEERMGITVAPAFADVINDPQPAWSDVTYLRLYLDHPIGAKVKKDQPPYIFFDVAKASFNPGRIINRPLWNKLIDVIPFFQKQFGIDGARIDMGHALPAELNNELIMAARLSDCSFALIAEELNNENAKHAKLNGYNAIISDGFYKIPRIKDFLFHQYFYDASKYPLPLLFHSESHDTPRAMSREGGFIFARLALAVSLFTPNTVPFINSGQEIGEVIPMNLGLDHHGDKHSKLALFDRVTFNYGNKVSLIGFLHYLTSIRNTIISPSYLPLGFLHMREHGAGMAYLHDDHAYLVIAHTNMHDSENITVRFDNVKKALKRDVEHAMQIYSTSESPRTIYSFNFDGSLNLWMEPGEIKIIYY